MKDFFFNRRGIKKQFVISTLMVFGTGTICYILSPYIGYRVVAFILLLTVSTTAILFDILPVLIAALLSALVWNFFFIPPRFTFSIGQAEDIFMFFMYFVVAIVNGVLTYKIRQMEKVYIKKEEKERTLALYNTLFNSLSHELKTPISAIIGASDALKENNAKISEAGKTELVNQVSLASLRLHQQVENLLNMSRLESGHLQLKPDWCDVRELIHHVVNKLSSEKGNRRIIVDIPESLPLFYLDFGIIEQVIYNLLKNAIQYTPDFSTITVQIESQQISHDEEVMLINSVPEIFTPRGNNSIQQLKIKLIDNGPGFPLNEIDKVFDKFYRLQHSHAGGTGLGLSIVKGFVEAHQGRVELRNQQTGGAEFTITIPANTSFINLLKNE